MFHGIYFYRTAVPDDGIDPVIEDFSSRNDCQKPSEAKHRALFPSIEARFSGQPTDVTELQIFRGLTFWKTNPKNLFVGTEDLFFTLFGTLADTNVNLHDFLRLHIHIIG